MTWEDFSWLPEGRILYIADEPGSNGNYSTNFWEAKADTRTGAPVGKPRRLSDLIAFPMNTLSTSTDGKKATFLKFSGQSSISVARLQKRGLLGTPRRLTFENRYDFPWDWTADSKSVLFTRAGTDGTSIYKQAIDSDTPDLILALKNRWSTELRTAPGGDSVLFLQQAMLERIPISGGVPQTVAKGVPRGISCPLAPATECILEQIDDQHRQSRFMAYSVTENKTRDLFTLPLPNAGGYWNISPDGLRIAMLQSNLHNGSIQIRSLNGKVEREFRVRGWNELKYIDWAADGKSLFIGGIMPKAVTLLRSDLNGHAQVLWSGIRALTIWATPSPGGWVIPSPDGKHIAIRDEVIDQNAWLLEGF
jgi:Tol biopolymer transport system component